jgi:ABC-type sugar transport system ATPase subunit
MASVVLKNLDKKFPNGVHAVRDLNLHIADGELVVLVGPSGCGKSTTLRMIAGLDEPTGGEIHIGDRLVSGIAPGDRDVAMVFQNYALYPHLSVYQNIAFGLKMRRTPKEEIEKRVREAAVLLSIESMLDRRPHELSGGQRQRVALGRAIVREPKVFLFDEPLSNLDAQLRMQMRTEIACLHRRLKSTIIYVTHDQAEAMTLGERIVLMDHGSVQQVGAPMEIYRRPANRFVASFIGSPAMNLIPGNVHQGVFRYDPANSGPGDSRVGIAYSELHVGQNIPDGAVVLGVRPEDLFARDGGAPLGMVTLDAVEHLGHETIAHFALAGAQLMARLAADAKVQPGDPLPLSIRPGAFHLFSGDDGRRLN